MCPGMLSWCAQGGQFCGSHGGTALFPMQCCVHGHVSTFVRGSARVGSLSPISRGRRSVRGFSLCVAIPLGRFRKNPGGGGWGNTTEEQVRKRLFLRARLRKRSATPTPGPWNMPLGSLDPVTVFKLFRPDRCTECLLGREASVDGRDLAGPHGTSSFVGMSAS